MLATWRWTAREIRERGAGFDREEIIPGVSCVAVPLYGPRGEVVAALCSMVPAGRDLTKLAETLTRSSRAIGETLRRSPVRTSVPRQGRSATDSTDSTDDSEHPNATAH
jgi:DNA-binding IclR family transcriptional regulator